MHTDKVNWMQNESQNKRYIPKWQFPAEVEYLSRFGAQTIARFLQVMPVLSLNDAIRDKCRIRNAQVLCNNNSSNIGSTVHTIARLYNNRSLTSKQTTHKLNQPYIDEPHWLPIRLSRTQFFCSFLLTICAWSTWPVKTRSSDPEDMERTVCGLVARLIDMVCFVLGLLARTMVFLFVCMV